MNVVFVAPGFSARRTQRQPWAYVYQVARGLVERGFGMRVLTDQAEVEDVQVPFPIQTVRGLRGPRAWFGPLADASNKSEQPDVVIPFLSWLNVASEGGEGAGESYRVAAITSPPPLNGEWRNLLFEGDSPVERAHLLLSHLASLRLGRDSFASFEGVVAPSFPVYDFLTSRVNGTPILHAPSGIEPDVPRPSRRSEAQEGGGPLVIYCGPPRKSRGFRIFVEGLRIIQSRRPDVKAHLLLRPDTPEDRANLSWLKSRLRTVPVPDRVKVEDAPLPRGDFLSALAQATVCVFPFQYAVSLTPISLLEAVAMGVPTVVTPVGDLPAVAGANSVVAQDTGPLAVAEAVIRLIERERNGGSNEPAQRPPTWNQVSELWAEFLRALIPV